MSDTFIKITNEDIWDGINIMQKDISEIKTKINGVEGHVKTVAVSVKNNEKQINRLWVVLGSIGLVVLGVVISIIKWYFKSNGGV